jgi:hypothetical protein
VITILEMGANNVEVDAALGSGLSRWSSRSHLSDWWIFDPSTRSALLQIWWRCLGSFIKPISLMVLEIEHVSDELDTEFRKHTFRIPSEKQKHDLKIFCFIKWLKLRIYS